LKIKGVRNGYHLVLGQKTWIFALQFGGPDVNFLPVHVTLGGFMSTGAERREARRFTMSLPLRVLDSPRSGGEIDTETRDVSYRGLYFMAESDFEAGKAINFVITLPENVTGGDVKIRCQGEVVRVESAVNGRRGIAAKIEHYEFVPTTSVA
jgi:hypothetical protein